MKKPVEYSDGSGLKTIIIQNDNGGFNLKNYYNNIKIDIALYDLTGEYLGGLQSAIGEFLAQN